MHNAPMVEFSTIDIEALARDASAGDSAALNSLLAAARPEAIRLCARFLPNREDAEEACQDTLWAVARGIGQFNGASTFRTWLHRIAATGARGPWQAPPPRSDGVARAGPRPDRPDPRRTSVVA